MNDIVSLDKGNPVTTSIAIADGTSVQHKNVLELVRRNIEDLQEFGTLAFETRVNRKDGRGGQKAEIAILNEQQATLLLTYMRNNEVVRRFKKTLVKAFYELAKANQQPNKEPSKLEVIQMALESEKERLRLEAKVSEDAPKVAFHDQVTIADGLISISEAAKIIGTGRNNLMSFLRKEGWVFSNGKKNEPYQAKIHAGLMDVKMGEWEHPDKGVQTSVTPVITGKGLTKLNKLFQQRMRENEQVANQTLASLAF